MPHKRWSPSKATALPAPLLASESSLQSQECAPALPRNLGAFITRKDQTDLNPSFSNTDFGQRHGLRSKNRRGGSGGSVWHSMLLVHGTSGRSNQKLANRKGASSRLLRHSMCCSEVRGQSCQANNPTQSQPYLWMRSTRVNRAVMSVPFATQDEQSHIMSPACRPAVRLHVCRVAGVVIAWAVQAKTWEWV